MKERDIITIVGREESVKKAREELEARIKELVRYCSQFLSFLISRANLIVYLKNGNFRFLGQILKFLFVSSSEMAWQQQITCKLVKIGSN